MSRTSTMTYSEKRKKAAQRDRKRREERKRMGLCPRCGEREPEDGRINCRECLDVTAAQRNVVYAPPKSHAEQIVDALVEELKSSHQFNAYHRARMVKTVNNGILLLNAS